jgi:hypothetical protein
MSGASTGQIGICCNPDGGCHTPTVLVCPGSAPKATAGGKLDNPQAQASIKQIRTIF